MAMLKRIALGVSVILGIWCSQAFAGEIDVLVNKLVEKGVLTQGEADQLVTEAKEEARKEIAQGKNEVLPKWLQTTKFSGDMRVRYQGEDHSSQPASSGKHRDRGRFRLRYGFDMKPNELMHVGFRMATGDNKAATSGPEQTSTNQTFTNTFNSKWIWVDQAYVDFTPFGNKDMPILKDMKLTGGKFPNPFYTTDMVWDSDTNPEGGYVQFAPQFGTLKPFLTVGFFPIGENAGENNDPFMFGLQGGLAGTVKNRGYKLGIAYFNYDNIKGNPINAYSSSYTPTIYNSNASTVASMGSTNAAKLLKYDFNIVEFCGEFSPIDFNLLDWTLPFTVLADYAVNTAKGDIKEDTAWLAGFKLGKAKDKGTWEMFYNYREVGQDSVYAMVSDSDFHLGGVASKGHKFGLTYAVMPNSTVSATYFATQPYKFNVGTSLNNKNINIIQIDWVTKF